MSNIITLLTLPVFPFTVIMSLTYAVNGVFKYEFRNKKTAYIVSLAMAVVTGIAGDVGYILFPLEQHCLSWFLSSRDRRKEGAFLQMIPGT